MKLYRKVLCLNHTSLTMNIPSNIVKEMGIRQGDYISIDYNKGIMTVKKAPNKIKQISEAQKK